MTENLFLGKDIQVKKIVNSVCTSPETNGFAPDTELKPNQLGNHNQRVK